MTLPFSLPTYFELGLSLIKGALCREHRLSTNRPTKRGKEKSPSDGRCQCEKEMDDHFLAFQQILEKEPHSDRPS
jgi:hypothetical protein